MQKWGSADLRMRMNLIGSLTYRYHTACVEGWSKTKRLSPPPPFASVISLLEGPRRHFCFGTFWLFMIVLLVFFWHIVCVEACLVTTFMENSCWHGCRRLWLYWWLILCCPFPLDVLGGIWDFVISQEFSHLGLLITPGHNLRECFGTQDRNKQMLNTPFKIIEFGIVF